MVGTVKLPAADTSHRRLVTFGGWKERKDGTMGWIMGDSRESDRVCAARGLS